MQRKHKFIEQTMQRTGIHQYIERATTHKKHTLKS